MTDQWDRALEVGIESIDAQHRELRRRAAAFLRAVEGRSPRDVGTLLSYLRSYAVVHFGEEEEAMRRVAYPGYDRHKAQHDRFMRDLISLSAQQERPRGARVAPAEVGRWLRAWLSEHVARTDMDMARYFEHLQVESREPAGRGEGR
jgi:hemerythrin